MKTEDIVIQLQKELVKYSNYFNDVLSIATNGVTHNNGTVTVTTSTAHGLSTNDYIVVTGVKSKNPITSLTRVGTKITAQTSTENDLTLWNDEVKNIEIIGSNQSAYNGLHNLYQVNDYKQFQFLVSGNPVTPATGTMFLLEQREYEYNGRFKITKISDTSFSYQIEKTTANHPYIDANSKFCCRFKIAGIGGDDSASLNHTLESYTPQLENSLWLFVGLGQELAHKNKDNEFDSFYFQDSLNKEFFQYLMQPISLFVVFPTSNYEPVLAKDFITNTFKAMLFSSVVGFKPATYLNTDKCSSLTFINSETIGYNGAYYIHRFSFESITRINKNDIYLGNRTVKLQHIDVNYHNSFNEIIRADSIDLPD